MQSLNEKFDELRHRLGTGRQIDSAGTEPIFYLVFPVSELLAVKARTKSWVAKLENEGWTVITLSLGEVINKVIGENKLRNFWLSEEKANLDRAAAEAKPIDFTQIRKTLENALAQKPPGNESARLSPALAGILDQAIENARLASNGLLLLTDVEALHPFLRINSIESYLQGKVQFPVVVLYPGQRAGKTMLKFLEFYPPDPNYRSEHIG
jgi:hypothetical protein